MHFDLSQYHFNNAEVLDGLDAKSKKLLLSKTQQRKFKGGKLIYREGKKPKGVYILRKGRVKIYQTGQDGIKQIMYLYTEGEMFGYRPIICDEVHPVTAVAFDDCACDFIPRAHFLKCVTDSAALSRLLLVSLSHEFSVWVNNITVFARYPVKSRVALGLLILQEKFKTKDRSNEVILSRSEFASYIGTVKEMVVRVVQELKKNKIVETQGSKIRILKPEELKAIVKFY
jgi:CRP-like cAMP-binding protein